MTNQFERAYRLWPILVEGARDGEKLTYGELGRRLSIHHRTVKYALDKIQKYCSEEKLPPLTILAVDKATQEPSEGFVAWDVHDLEHGLKVVWNYSWDSIENPFQFASDGTTFDALVARLGDDAGHAQDVYAMVKVRGIAQQIFREALLKIYFRKCALTEVSFLECLDAAHLVPWSDATSSQRMNPRNGILMSAIHHRLFDQQLLTVDEDYRIRYYDADMTQRRYSNTDKQFVATLHGNQIRLPSNRNWWPDKDWIRSRNSKIEWFQQQVR